MDKRKVIGTTIRNFRKIKGWPLRELADKCDMDPGNLSKIETAKINPSLRTLFRIANGLGVSPGKLIDLTYVEEQQKSWPVRCSECNGTGWRIAHATDDD